MPLCYSAVADENDLTNGMGSVKKLSMSQFRSPNSTSSEDGGVGNHFTYGVQDTAGG